MEPHRQMEELRQAWDRPTWPQFSSNRHNISSLSSNNRSSGTASTITIVFQIRIRWALTLRSVHLTKHSVVAAIAVSISGATLPLVLEGIPTAPTTTITVAAIFSTAPARTITIKHISKASVHQTTTAAANSIHNMETINSSSNNNSSRSIRKCSPRINRCAMAVAIATVRAHTTLPQRSLLPLLLWQTITCRAPTVTMASSTITITC